jgi:dTDP-4-dehydrorhamnose 3,5-epimerase
MIQQFEFKETSLRGAYIIKPFLACDERGAFVKDYNINTFYNNHIQHELKEVFYTISKKGVIRAIHFQLQKQQAKLVRCIHGHIYDIIVDLRPNSPTFGEWIGYHLSENNSLMLFVPEFFGHGYLVLEDSIVSYKCNQVFYAEGDSGIKYDDPQINIRWPFEEIGGMENLIISEKDKNLMSFETYKSIVKY